MVKGVKMRNLGKLWVIMALSFAVVNAASVKATVNTVEVVKGNPVQLRIKATGGSAAFPKILMVADAPVTGRSTSSSQNYTMSNGAFKSEKSTTQTIQFVPEHNMTIPSYTVNISGKKYKTSPIEITVIKAGSTTMGAGQSSGLFSLEMRANKSKVMVGESFMVTVYFSLRRDVRLSQEVQYVAPTFPSFTVADAGEQNAYVKGNYQVQEVRYILTAQQEGNFTASPASAKVGLPDKSRRDIFGMTFGTKWQQMASNSLDIEVLPQTQESDLVGDFTVVTTIDAQEVKANKPVNMTLKIEGKGNLENFEFPKYEIDAVMIYSDEAKVETTVRDGELFSSYSKSFAFISEEDFTIPERSFTMLTSKEHKVEPLNVQSYEIKIKTSAKTTAVATPPTTNGVVQTNQAHTIETKEVVAEKEVIKEVKTVAWWMLAVAFGLGALFVLLLRWLATMKPRKASPYKESEALKILYAHMSENVDIEAMVRKLYARKNGDKSVQIDKKELKEMVERFR